MDKEEIIALFPKCRICGCKETLTHKGWVYIYPEDQNIPFTSFPGIALPMTAHSMAMNMSLPSVPALAVFKDFCAKCGIERAIKAVKTTVPGEMLRQAMGVPPMKLPKNMK